MKPRKVPEKTDKYQVRYSEKEYLEMPDEMVWTSFNKGNESTFSFLYKNYASDLFAFGYQFCGDAHLVEDCIQNLFIYLRKRRGRLGEVRSIKSYLFKCIRSEIIKRMKERGQLMDADEMHYKKSFALALSPETILIESEHRERQQKRVKHALAQLTVRQRQALLLLYEEEMSYSQIAEVMGFSDVKSARKLVYRALASLKDVFLKK
ncbi:RNA polymerase subunit sigma-24 [Echinicola strongylocentroti]|uniref:RNA polymerase subunit sigma-24 n=1 Tax=Echinicola strongylocentroti TaxID=1795355 RepID=A0A2Z4IE06_9BACT|nr:sigma-70 family RNA polymerase sigma factor [Echinicola strongylocentroti]AWW29049.1 RNA polymerase subunit sigma-24 [Echinicola strongylocentroti]